MPISAREAVEQARQPDGKVDVRILTDLIGEASARQVLQEYGADPTAIQQAFTPPVEVEAPVVPEVSVELPPGVPAGTRLILPEGYQQVVLEQGTAPAQDLVPVGDGEFIARADFVALSAEDQNRIKELGVSGYNQYLSDKQKEFERDNVQTRTGEYVSLEAFQALTAEQQENLLNLGVKQFNELQEIQRERFERENVQLKTGEFVPQAEFTALSPEQQRELQTLGTDRFTKLQQIRFEQDNVKLKSGEFVPKSEFEALPLESQKELQSLGTERFNKLQGIRKEQSIAERKEWLKQNVVIAGGTEDKPVGFPREEFVKLPVAEQKTLLNEGYDQWGAKYYVTEADLTFKKEDWDKLKDREKYYTLLENIKPEQPPAGYYQSPDYQRDLKRAHVAIYGEKSWDDTQANIQRILAQAKSAQKEPVTEDGKIVPPLISLNKIRDSVNKYADVLGIPKGLIAALGTGAIVEPTPLGELALAIGAGILIAAGAIKLSMRGGEVVVEQASLSPEDVEKMRLKLLPSPVTPDSMVKKLTQLQGAPLTIQEPIKEAIIPSEVKPITTIIDVPAQVKPLRGTEFPVYKPRKIRTAAGDISENIIMAAGSTATTTTAKPDSKLFIEIDKIIEAYDREHRFNGELTAKLATRRQIVEGINRSSQSTISTRTQILPDIAVEWQPIPRTESYTPRATAASINRILVDANEWWWTLIQNPAVKAAIIEAAKTQYVSSTPSMQYNLNNLEPSALSALSISAIAEVLSVPDAIAMQVDTIPELVYWLQSHQLVVTDTKTQLQYQIDWAAQTATVTDIKTGVQQKLAFQSAVEELVKSATATSVATKSAIATATKDMTAENVATTEGVSTVPLTSVKPITGVKSAMASATGVMAIPAVKTAVATATATAQPRPIKLPREEKKKKNTEKSVSVKSAIAWRQGAVGRPPQDVWYVISSPYRSASDVTRYIGVLPTGVTDVMPGKGSALRSIQTITGIPPARLEVDLGIQDITITDPDGVGEPGAIQYNLDKKERTTGDITIKGNIKTIRKKTFVRRVKHKKKKKRKRSVSWLDEGVGKLQGAKTWME